jgi:N-acyl-D-aspartate/D-glutamate deacylase
MRPRPTILTRAALAGLLAALFALSVPGPASAQQIAYDVLIRGGQVVDGTGRAAFEADVGVRDGEIAAVGDLGEATADRTIDASGLVVAPGFIDVHTHVARAMADSATRLNEAFLRQGVTTVVGGPDGQLSPGMIRLLLDAYEEHGIGTNVAFYVGHNGVRLVAMGDVERPLTEEKLRSAFARRGSETYQREPTAEEIETMKALVREGMELGAVGLSTGLMYPPGMHATTDEVVELAREVAPHGGIYDSHVRDPARQWLASNREAIEIGRRAGVPVKLAHLKAVGTHNTGKVDSLVAMVEAARQRGVRVVSDQYPYDAAGGSIHLKDLILVEKDPERNAKLLADPDSLSALLADPERRRRIREQSEQGIDGGFSWIRVVGYSGLRVTRSPDHPELVGRYLSEIAGERGVDPFDLVADLYLGADEPVDVKGGIEEETVRQILRQPWNMIASDGSFAGPGNGHPRATGTFPRVLGRYVRELGVLTLEEAIRKMTSLPADVVGLTGRGRLAEGRAADIVVFDSGTIEDRSTYRRPNLLATGVRHVLVDGVPVLLEEELTGRAPGRFLQRRPQP